MSFCLFVGCCLFFSNNCPRGACVQWALGTGSTFSYFLIASLTQPKPEEKINIFEMFNYNLLD